MDKEKKKSKVDNCWQRIGVWGDSATRCPRLQEIVHCHNCDVFRNASLDVLEQPLDDDYRSEWTEMLSCAKNETLKGTSSVIVFRLGVEWVAIATNLCKEITNILKIHSLPHNKSNILKGIVNVNGEIQTCYSLGSILGIKKAENPPGDGNSIVYERLIMIERDGKCFAFPASEIRGIYNYRQEELEELPRTVAEATASYLKGVIKWGDLCIGCLDEEALISRIERSIRY